MAFLAKAGAPVEPAEGFFAIVMRSAPAAAIIAARPEATMPAAKFSDVSAVSGPKNLRHHFGQKADVN